MMPKSFRTIAAGATIAVASMLPAHAAPIDVDLELSLLIDVSGSVNATEFNLQKTGYVNAFNDSSLWDAIAAGVLDKIAVNLIYWSGRDQQQQAVGWTLIDSFSAAQSFANAILATIRPFSGLTAPGSAINFASALFGSNDYNGTRNVIRAT